MGEVERGVVVSFFYEVYGFSPHTDFSCEVFLGEVVACSEFFDSCFHGNSFSVFSVSFLFQCFVSSPCEEEV